MKIDTLSKESTAHPCNHCGSCCRSFPYILLSQDDIKTIERFTGLAAAEFTDSIDKAGDKRFMKFHDNGDCIFLENIDCAFSCSVYEARSAACRNYPSTDIQLEACRVWSGVVK